MWSWEADVLNLSVSFWDVHNVTFTLHASQVGCNTEHALSQFSSYSLHFLEVHAQEQLKERKTTIKS